MGVKPAIIIATVLTLAGCGSTAATTTASTIPGTIPAATPAKGTATASPVPAALTVDPYAQYEALIVSWGIKDAPILTADAALARALLGCTTTWPPKTVDAALAQAYATQIADARKAGHCS